MSPALLHVGETAEGKKNPDITITYIHYQEYVGFCFIIAHRAIGESHKRTDHGGETAQTQWSKIWIFMSMVNSESFTSF